MVSWSFSNLISHKNSKSALFYTIKRTFILLVLLFPAACTSFPEEIIGVDNATIPAKSVVGAKQHKIFIATTRQPDAASTIMFTGERNDSLSFARVTVSVPPNHIDGNIERPTRIPPDPRKEFAVIDPVLYSSEKGFVAGIDNEILRKPKKEQHVLVFVHGYNTTLAAAILRAGQFVEDSNFTGVLILFTWASRGSTLSYVYDMNSALHARDALLDTAKAINRTKAKSINVLAHSMGNLVTVEAMRQAKLEGWFNNSGRLKNIILASPDIDSDVFRKQIQVFPKEKRRFYVLISEDDKALAFSRKIAGGVNRVGDDSAEELAKIGVVVIDLSKIDDTNNLNHSKFADSPEVVQLIGTRLNAGDNLHTEKILAGNVGSIGALPGLTTKSIGLGILSLGN